MKKYQGFFLATVAGVSFAPAATQAADLPLRKAPVYVPETVSWQGLYIGAHLGGASQKNQVGGDDYNSVAFIGGGQIGYNWQQGNFVFGLEADGSWLSKPDGAYALTNNPPDVTTYGSHISWLSTVRGRLGYAFGNRGDWLVYGTAGLAIGGVKARNDDCCVSVQSYSKTRLGWAVGGGLEHMLTRNWTIGAEALYVDFGAKNLYNGNSEGKAAYVSNSAIIGRLKLNYKF